MQFVTKKSNFNVIEASEDSKALWGLMGVDSRNLPHRVGSRDQVAVIDTGFDGDQLKEGFTTGFNGKTRDSDVIVKSKVYFPKKGLWQLQPHGTRVAHILKSMVPYVTILPGKVGSKYHRDSMLNILEFLLTQDQVKVVNISYGIGPDGWNKYYKAVRQLTEQGKTIVFAAGNNFEDATICINEDFYLESGEKFSTFLHSLKGRVVFVVASEGVEERASFSHVPCPELAPFYIAAPGANIRTRSINNQLVFVYGTSFAAPVFSACLMQLATEFDLSVDEAREALFKMATHAEYTGRGIINFKAAREILKLGEGTKQLEEQEAYYLFRKAG